MPRIKILTAKVCVFVLVSAIITASTLAQTRITPPKNPYPPAKDVELGRQAAAEAERKLQIVNDREIQRYIERVGSRLVESIPPEFQHGEFQYSFKVVNAKDINAFALPGGFTYVNTGLIDVAKNEGEMAGVMAHEISHVALRHGTAQAAKAQKYAIGATAGQVLGAIIGGGLGGVVAQGSNLGIGAYFLRYSREYERQADLLGSHIMANAGYDPRDLANMFRTIEQSSGKGGGPEWLSSHPNPGNRYETINREAQYLTINKNLRDTGDFASVQSRLRGVASSGPSRQNRNGSRDNSRNDPRYDSRNDPQNDPRYDSRNDPRNDPRYDSRNDPQNDPRYDSRNDPQNDPRYDSRGDVRRTSSRVELPSTRFRSYRGNNIFSLNVPDNWRDLGSRDSVTFAPEGAYAEVQGRFIFTHGVLVGVSPARSRDLRQATENFLDELSQGNPNLHTQGSYRRTVLSGRDGLSISLTNISDVTGQTELIGVFTTLLRNGNLFYMIPVAPQSEYKNYLSAFREIIQSVALND